MVNWKLDGFSIEITANLLAVVIHFIEGVVAHKALFRPDPCPRESEPKDIGTQFVFAPD